MQSFKDKISKVLILFRHPRIWLPAAAITSIIASFMVDFFKDLLIPPLGLQERLIIILVLMSVLTLYTLISTFVGLEIFRNDIEKHIRVNVTSQFLDRVNDFDIKLENVKESLAKSITGLPVKLEDEIYDPNEKFEGKVYSRLRDEIEKANESVRVLTLATLGDDETGNYFKQPQRNEYIDALNGQIAKHLIPGKQFVYHRIYQRSPKLFIDDDKKIDGLAQRHVNFVINYIENVSEDVKRKAKENVEIRVIPTSRNTGFMIIDMRKLILMISGVTEEGTPYMHALLIFENVNGEADDLIKQFYDRFQVLRSITLPPNSGDGRLYPV